MSITAKDLTHTYSPGTTWEATALKDVNLTIDDGEIIGLIGHTGSGKSTLIQHFNGLLRPTSGALTVQGIEVTAHANLRKLRQKVGLVFQYPEHQLFEETVLADVAFGPKNLGLPQEDSLRRAQTALAAVGLELDQVKDRSPFELSGGQMRRVAIAGVLAMEPEVLILDEPTAGLDPKSRNELMEHLRRIHKERDLTLVIVSHSMEEVAAVAHRLLVMDKGSIFTQGTPRQVFSRGEELRAIGLDVPPLTKLMLALQRQGVDVATDVLNVQEARAAIQQWRKGENTNV